jgi:uncharacterized membrane protein
MLPHFPGSLIAYALSLVVSAAFVLAVPAVVQLNMRPLDAIAYSVRRFAIRPLPFLGYYLGALVLGLSGALACGIGLVFTLGVLFVAPTLLMLEPKTGES